MGDHAGQTSSASKRPRADARANHERILRAARSTFGEHGVDVQMSDVARRAGVAIGTIYRHFPTKEALVEALLAEELRTAGQAARRAAAEGATPWDSLEGFLRTVAAHQISDRTLSQFIGGRVLGSTDLRTLLNSLFDTFTVLVDSAKASGDLRMDVEAADIRMAIICVARASWENWPETEWVLERYLQLVLDGLRAPGYGHLRGSRPIARDFALPNDTDEPTPAFRPGRPRWKPDHDTTTRNRRFSR